MIDLILAAIAWVASIVIVSLLLFVGLFVYGTINSTWRRWAYYRRDRHLMPLPGEIWDHGGRPMRIEGFDMEGPILRFDHGVKFETWGDWRAECRRARRFRAHGSEIAVPAEALALRSLLH